MARWIPFGADSVLDLPTDLYRAWPADLRPTAASCPLGFGRPGVTPAAESGADTDLIRNWVARAAVVMAAGPVQAAFHIATEQFRVVVGAAVLGSSCCAVLRWHPWEGAMAGRGAPDPAAGYLLGRIEAASALPDLIAELVPAGAVTVLGSCGLRGTGPHKGEKSCTTEPRQFAGSSWMLHDCAECPHAQAPGAATPAALRGGGAEGDLPGRVRQRIRADLLRVCLSSVPTGELRRRAASPGASSRSEGGHGP